MDIGTLFLFLIIIFAVVYFAVRMAIKPLLEMYEGPIDGSQDSDLIKLRDMDILNNDELEEVIQLFEGKSKTKGNMEQYQKYAKIMDDLKEMEYFTYEQKLEKIDKLKEYFKLG